MLWYFSDDSKKAHESVVQSGSDDNVETQIDAMAQVRRSMAHLEKVKA